MTNSRYLASISLCRMSGVTVISEPAANGSVSCPLFLGSSAATIEFSADDGETFYVLDTVPLSSSSFATSWNQLDDPLRSLLHRWVAVYSLS